MKNEKRDQTKEADLAIYLFSEYYTFVSEMLRKVFIGMIFVIFKFSGWTRIFAPPHCSGSFSEFLEKKIKKFSRITHHCYGSGA